ncbi:MAG: vitamin K epoxide reductase family protein [Verrucomicrobiales bacterium]
MTTPEKRQRAWLVAKILLGLACVGAGYLLAVALKNGPVAGCGSGSSCDTVLKSRWAYLLPGVPVTAPALFTYLVLLFGLIFRSGSKAWEGVMLVGSLMVIGAAAWFVGLQVVVLKSYCIYCLGTHALGVAGSICLLVGLRPIQRELIPLGAAAAAMGLAMLAACQIFMPQATTAETQIGADGLSGTGPRFNIAGQEIDLSKFPFRGDLSSDKRLIVLFDYTCSSCRRVHAYLDRAEARFGGDNYLVVMLPTPLNPDCNRHFDEKMSDHRNACLFASMGFALWATDREKFYEYDRWMIETGTSRYPPEADAARAKAEELIGKEQLAKAMADPAITENIEKVCEIWNTFKASTGVRMPKMLWSGGTLTTGAVGSEFELFDMMEERLGLERLN